MAKTIRVPQARLNSLDYHVIPSDGGQIVVVRYAEDEDGLWRWCYDRSDRTSTYAFARYDRRASEKHSVFTPWNDVLPWHRVWQKVVVDDTP